MAITTQILLSAFIITFVMGMIAVKTNFCTMGAVSDVVNMGDTGRMRAWFFAMATAIIGVIVLQLTGQGDITLTSNGEAAIPPYRTAMFAWPRYLLGGLLFGIGMTIGSGCGNKNLLRVGGGNIKSIFVLAVMGIAAYLMIFTNFGYNVFLSWMTPAFVDFASFGINDQSIPTLISSIFGIEVINFPIIVGLAIAGLILLWVIKSRDFRSNWDNILGGLAIGLAVVAAWYVTTGPMGQALMEEVDFLDERPLAVGAQALTFVQPTGQVYNWAMSGFNPLLVTFAMFAGAGALFGSFVYSIVFRKFKIEWFTDWKDFANHLVGGLLMGLGGVLGMGCTVGQGISGASTLALGSFVTMGSIILGSALMMKFQYYRMVYEEEATIGKALVASLADLKLLPNGMRQLDAI